MPSLARLVALPVALFPLAAPAQASLDLRCRPVAAGGVVRHALEVFEGPLRTMGLFERAPSGFAPFRHEKESDCLAARRLFVAAGKLRAAYREVFASGGPSFIVVAKKRERRGLLPVLTDGRVRTFGSIYERSAAIEATEAEL